ncbi:hypothetical protein [Agrobacterium salinitolerans]|uniref:hypothetical protein n=1 Tax=Agrobacterium salinitolerans TaxID=1183413 RepID=UPI001573C634|nr:hypothetical protein [Agrobacterium salinitolerans]NTA36842.1 hypothetical protein [Agrobacterium salinitolerans]
MHFARLDGNTVAEVLEFPSQAAIEAAFHPDIAKTIFRCTNKTEVGWVYEDGVFAPPQDAIDLQSIKAILKSSVDTEAEGQRLKYITPGAGQALTYMQKSDEARRYLSEDNPDAANYPLLSAEVGITADDMAGVASAVSAAFAQWQQIGAAIEAARLGGKASIDASGNAADAQEAFNAIAWPAP